LTDGSTPPNKDIYLSLLAALISLFLSMPSAAAVKAEECLGCHDKYEGASHKGVGCLDCHSSVTDLPHADKMPKPDCTRCHEKTVGLYKTDFHNRLGLACGRCHNVHFLNKEQKSCTSCHGSVKHAAMPSKPRHLGSLPCLACHGLPEKTELRIRVTVWGKKAPGAATIDTNGNHPVGKEEWNRLEDLLQHSFEGNYSVEKRYLISGGFHTVTTKPAPCGACHSESGYFSDALLKVGGSRSYEIPVDRRAFIPLLPASEDFSRTVHGESGVTCVDCHGSEKKTAHGWKMDSTVCAKCHTDVSEAHSQSVHVKKNAAVCVDCHNPHRIKSYRDLTAEERTAICARCHGNYVGMHRWLPNTRLHFSYLECATCHSPGSQKSMVYYFAEEENGAKAPLSYDRLVALCGQDPAKSITGGGDGETDSRIGRLFTVLKRRNKHIIIDASIIVTKVYHNYTETRIKEKECLSCHSRQAEFYDSMLFRLPAKESVSYIPVKGTVFSSYPIETFVDLFLLGEEKLTKRDFQVFFGLKEPRETERVASLSFKLIDFIGLFLMFLVLAGICVHVTLRLTVKR
jgi:predicted CXXCH cytochrome family protein